MSHLSVRGKNVVFINELAAALQLDNLGAQPNLERFKRAFTPQAVHRIFEAVARIWPSGDDVERTLRTESSGSSALYFGDYGPEVVLREVTRHSLYTDRLILVDPFPHPRTMREEFNPLLRPEMFRATALRYAWLWLTLAPWIEADLVHFIRTPGDFDHALALETYRTQRDRFGNSPELSALAQEEAAEYSSSQSLPFQRELLLDTPDNVVRTRMQQRVPPPTSEEVESAIAWLHEQRANNPYYLPPLEGDGRRSSEMLLVTRGTNYEMAKITARKSGSYLLTDSRASWRQVELDREAAGLQAGSWSPLAKAFHEVQLSYLNDVPLAAALTLRKEGRLEDMRGFMRRVWKASATGNPFAAENAELLAAELHHHVMTSEVEWQRINRELGRWLGVDVVAGALTAVVHAKPEWAAAAVAVTAGVQLALDQRKREEHRTLYPAAFFADIRASRRSEDG